MFTGYCSKIRIELNYAFSTPRSKLCVLNYTRRMCVDVSIGDIGGGVMAAPNRLPDPPGRVHGAPVFLNPGHRATAAALTTRRRALETVSAGLGRLVRCSTGSRHFPHQERPTAHSSCVARQTVLASNPLSQNSQACTCFTALTLPCLGPNSYADA
jgi:hypothetical protein